MKKISLGILTILFITSCNNKVFYEKIDVINNEVWNIDSLLEYQFDITDSLQYYNFYIDIRNTTDFKTQNFYLFMNTQFPDGQTFQDTLGCILSDKYGNWTGKGNGRIKENKFLFKPKVRFVQKGTYKFTVKQGMREDHVEGISNFGIILYYYDKDKLK